MSPKKLVTRRADPGQARARRTIAQKYLEVSDLVAAESGAAINVCVGLAVLAGIAAGDARSGARHDSPWVGDRPDGNGDQEALF